jgi:hypothetical protein
MKIILLSVSFILSLAGTGYSQKQVRGDENQLPLIDYSKQFDMKAFKSTKYTGFDRTFSTKTFDANKTLELPSYYGNLKFLPLTEWHSSKPDIYTKTLDLEVFHIKKTTDRWSNQLTLRNDDTINEKIFTNKESPYPTRNVETKEVEPGRVIGGQALKDLINKGTKPEPVKSGRGFSAKNLGEEKETTTEQPKTESQPK